jgi:hypothetical protein
MENYYNQYGDLDKFILNMIQDDEHHTNEVCYMLLNLYRDEIILENLISKSEKNKILQDLIEYYEGIKEYEKCSFILSIFNQINIC